MRADAKSADSLVARLYIAIAQSNSVLHVETGCQNKRQPKGAQYVED